LNSTKFRLRDQANSFCNEIWDSVLQWSWFEKDTLGKQLVRAADSIATNLSEASGRYSYPDRKKSAYYARGSLIETINWLKLAQSRNLLEANQANRFLDQSTQIAKQLNSYINHLKTH